jgi:3-deoxy-D-manno-octulosonate 8-phosphate phosphatase (KDO 8-P phosphatase)
MGDTGATNRPRSLSRVPGVFVIDVDGVMTDGTFWYSETGKMFKRFGPDDADALSLAARFMRIEFVSADRRGFPITRRRIVDDMGYELTEIGALERLEWATERHGLTRLIYMGDGIFDAPLLRAAAYGIAPADADPEACNAADFVTTRPGGRRAVSEACFHLLAHFFGVTSWQDARCIDPSRAQG